MLSIITPSYNNGNLLKRLYKSIKNQSYKEIHWIIVDDGSTDSTQKIIKEFRKIKITYINQDNRGTNCARNRGEKEILDDCKYVIYMDSDDTFFDKDSINMMVEDIEKTSKNIGAVGYTSIDSFTRKNFTFLRTSPLKVSYLDSIKGTSFNGEFISIQKVEILKYSQWPEGISGYEAIRHWKINKHCDYLLYSKPARVYHRDRKNNLTSPETTVKRSLNMAKSIEMLLNHYGKDLITHAKNKYYYYLLTQSLYYSLSGKNKKSVNSLLRSFSFNISIKNNIITILIIILLLLPTNIRCKLYIFIKNLNYNYS